MEGLLSMHRTDLQPAMPKNIAGKKPLWPMSVFRPRVSFVPILEFGSHILESVNLNRR